MLNIHIVTDSSAQFHTPHYVDENPITVVPNRIKLGGKTFKEGVSLSADEAIKQIARHKTPPTVIPASIAEYIQVYNQVAQTSDLIVSIHASRELYGSWFNARQAAQQLSGLHQIAVIDSQSLCMAQGMLAQIAFKEAAKTDSFDNLVRRIRSAVERIYSIYYVESVDYLLHNKIMSQSHGILGALLGIKPCVTIENGQLIPIEKVKTRLQAVERLVEYMMEFDDIEDAVILQPRSGITEQTRLLQDRLATEYPNRSFGQAVYSASLATLLGPDASGLVILEEEANYSDGTHKN